MTIHPPLNLLRRQLGEYLGARRPDLVTPLLRAFELLEAGERIEGLLLVRVVEAASDGSEAVNTFGTVLLGRAAKDDVAAQSAILEMLSSKSAGVRLNAVLCLNEDLPPSFSLRVLSSALLDKSPKVRSKAAERASQLRLNEIQAELHSAVLREGNARAKEVMSAELSMLRDGYYLIPSDSGSVYVTIEVDGSREMHLVQNREIQDIGIERIVATLQKNRGAP